LNLHTSSHLIDSWHGWPRQTSACLLSAIHAQRMWRWSMSDFCGGSEKPVWQAKVDTARKWQHIALFASRWRWLLDEDECHPWQTPTVAAWRVVYAVNRSILGRLRCRRYVAVDKCSPDDTSQFDELEIVSTRLGRPSCNCIHRLQYRLHVCLSLRHEWSVTACRINYGIFFYLDCYRAMPRRALL